MKKVFLGGLPKYFTDEKLREMFCSYGEITDYVVMKDPHSKESRGFGFIEFSTEEPVNQILKNRPHMIDNREIEVRRAMPKEITHTTIHERTKRVFVGGLGYEITEDIIRNYYNDKFGKYGRVESVEVKRDRDTNHSRGFAFISFDSEDTVDAVLILEPKPTAFGRNCEIKKSEPRRSDDTYRRPPRSRKRTPPSHSRDHRYEREDDYYPSYSPRAEYDRPRREYRYPAESRPIPPQHSDYPPALSYRQERQYERSPPVYRRYPPSETPSMYQSDTPYDRQYVYTDYHSTYSRPYSPGYDNTSPVSRPAPSSSNHQQPPPTRPASSGYASRMPMQYRQYEAGYRDRDTNPY